MNNNELFCLKCNSEIEIVDGEIINGTLEISNPMLDSVFICVKCRYFGATVKFLQWGLDPDKMSVDIIGALESTKRYCSNIRQYLGDVKNLMSKYSSEDQDERRKRIFKILTNIENITNAVEANENVAISQLMEFGK